MIYENASQTRQIQLLGLAYVSKEPHIEVRSGKKDQNNAIYLAVRVAAADAAAASGEW